MALGTGLPRACWTCLNHQGSCEYSQTTRALYLLTPMRMLRNVPTRKFEWNHSNVYPADTHFMIVELRDLLVTLKDCMGY